MEEKLVRGAAGNKCVYLTDKGCLWRYKPIVCEMFLCDHAKKLLGEKGASHMSRWGALREEEKNIHGLINLSCLMSLKRFLSPKTLKTL